MTAELVLTNARIVLPDSVIAGTLHVRNGLIRDIDTGRCGLSNATDLEGDYLIPGLIDLHTDNLEKHLMPRPGVRWDQLSAAVAHDAQVISAGITTVLDSLGVGSSVRSPERNEILGPMLDGIREARSRNLMRADHLLHLRCEVTDECVVGLFASLAADPLVRLMSVMDHAPGQRQSPDLARYRDRQIRMLGLSPDDADRHIERLVSASGRIGPRNRRDLADIAHAHSIRMASHDDETVEHVADAVELGMTICEFPTTRAAANAARAGGMQILMGAPNVIRGVSHSGNVAAGELARAGLLDVLSSDYVPISLLQAAFALAEEEIDFNLPQAIRTVTLNPAEAAGLGDRGMLAVGRRADLVRVRTDEAITVVHSVWREGQAAF